MPFPQASGHMRRSEPLEKRVTNPRGVWASAFAQVNGLEDLSIDR